MSEYGGPTAVVEPKPQNQTMPIGEDLFYFLNDKPQSMPGTALLFKSSTQGGTVVYFGGKATEGSAVVLLPTPKDNVSETLSWKIHDLNGRVTTIKKTGNQTAPVRHHGGQSVDTLAGWAKLEELFILRNEHELRAIFRSNPKVIPLALEAYKLYEKYFSSAANLILELVIDPESYETESCLFVVMQTALDVEDAMQRLYALEAEWLEKNINGRAMLTFDLEFL